MNITFEGVYTALVTPMKESGEVHWDDLTKLVDFQIDSGISGLVPVGTTGESPTLNSEEHIAVIAKVVELAKGRVPVIAGTGANSTAEAIELTQAADRAGADAFLQVAPYYNKPSPAGLLAHFSKIAESTDKPIVLYSIPGRCGIDIPVSVVKELGEKYPHVRTIKEAGGEVSRVTQLKEACGDKLTVLSGDDGLTVDFAREGARGVISVASNIAPKVMLSLTQAAISGDWAQAEAIQKEYADLLSKVVFMEGNPASIKEALFRTGRIESPAMRLPLVRMTEENQSAMASILQQWESLA